MAYLCAAPLVRLHCRHSGNGSSAIPFLNKNKSKSIRKSTLYALSLSFRNTSLRTYNGLVGGQHRFHNDTHASWNTPPTQRGRSDAPPLLLCVHYSSSEYMGAWYHQIVSFQEGKQCAVRGAYLACQGALVLCMKRSTYMLPCYFSDLITHIIMILPSFPYLSLACSFSFIHLYSHML